MEKLKRQFKCKCFNIAHYIANLYRKQVKVGTTDKCHIYLFTTLFNVVQTIVTRLIKTNLTKTNTGIIDKNFKIFDMQHKNSESFVHDSISV